MQLFKRKKAVPESARKLTEAELLAGFCVPDDHPLLRSILATINGERELARRRIAQGARESELYREAGRMAALDDLEADIARGVGKARDAAARRAGLRGRLGR